ncbi:NAD(P)-binding domain-containing protein [Kitasatospora sp. NBC_01539]|uniref:NAD(P)-binding domain-containing protein n=1 Tax=Kitasatospora sp. NBC_01539 TaxID=2903577 RepID=UPI00386012D6
MRVAVIGAGPAGLTSAKQALERGHEVVLYERLHAVGGIWNPASGGAYESVRMQSSRMSFPYSDFAPAFGTDFPTLHEVHGYLHAYAEHFGVLPVTRFGSDVQEVVRRDGHWEVTAGTADAAPSTERFDAVMVASGELWEARTPDFLPSADTGVQVLTAKQYRSADGFEGRRVLVVGGGVSGADIAAELAAGGASVDWSVRRLQLFLPRMVGGVYNDALLSYAARVAVEELPYQDYLKWLEQLEPEYFALYRESAILPTDGFHGAVHVNDRIVPAVANGQVRVRPAFGRFEPDGAAVFADGLRARYDTVVLCLGYGLPDYSFLPELRREDLYEHFFHAADPTLAIINTPVDTEAFGTACPYFEAIAGWALQVFEGGAVLPDADERARWCAENMHRLDDRRYYDCWLETVRIGLLAGTVPDPAQDFAAFWRLVSGQVDPAGLQPGTPAQPPGVHDALFDPAQLRLRMLAALDATVLDALVADGTVTAAEAATARTVPPGREIAPWLPYRQREHGTAGVAR